MIVQPPAVPAQTPRRAGRARIPSHAGGGVWSLRSDRREYVRPTRNGGVHLFLCDVGGLFYDITLDRRTARLLARRLQQMLDATTRGAA